MLLERGDGFKVGVLLKVNGDVYFLVEVGETVFGDQVDGQDDIEDEDNGANNKNSSNRKEFIAPNVAETEPKGTFNEG